MSTKDAKVNTNVEVESSKTITETSSKTILWILIGIIVIFIIIGIIYFVINPQIKTKSPASYQLEYQPFAFWSAASRTTDTERNYCNLYQFYGAHDNRFEPVNGVYRLIPAQPSVNENIVDQMPPLPPPGCYDVDQLILIKAEHTCIKLESLEQGDFIGSDAQGGEGISFCTTYNGDRAEIGSTEDYYSNGVTYLSASGESQPVNCGQLPCIGSIGLLGLGYRVKDYSNPVKPVAIQPVQDAVDGTWGMKCLILNPDNSTSVGACDGTDQKQIFRILRQQYGMPQPPASETRKVGTYGNTAIIVDRATGSTCLNYDVDKEVLVFNSQCNPYNWALFNAMNTATQASPQQFAYIGSLTDEQKQNLFLQKNPQDIWNTIREYNLFSLVLMQGVNIPGIAEFYIYDLADKSNVIGLHTNQLIEYTLFNDICFGTTNVGF